MDHETNLPLQPEALSADGDAPAGQEIAVAVESPAVAAAEDAAAEAPILLEPRSEIAAEPMEPLQLQKKTLSCWTRRSAPYWGRKSALFWKRIGPEPMAARPLLRLLPLQRLPQNRLRLQRQRRRVSPKMRKKARAKIRKPRQPTPAKQRLRLKAKRLKRSAPWAERSSALCAARCC